MEEVKKRKPIKTDEARRFANIRKMEKLTQAELAEVLGVKQPAIHKYEIGDLFIPTSIWKKLHEKLQYNYEYLINGTGKKKIANDKRDNILSNLQELNQKYDILSQKYEDLNTKMIKITRDFYAQLHNQD